MACNAIENTVSAMGVETQGWGEICGSPLPPWCKDTSEPAYGERELNCSTMMHCGVMGCKVDEQGVPQCPPRLGVANILYPEDCKDHGCKLLDRATGQLTTHIVCTGDTRETCAIRSP